MENIERPLTWVLAIALLGYLFIANCECGEEASCTAKNGFNIKFEDKSDDVNQEIRVEVQVEDENLNIDSIVTGVLEDIDIQGDIDTVINIDLTEEAKE